MAAPIILAVQEKCANPQCQAEFCYLGDGMLLRVPRLMKKSGSPKKTIAIERFWLCSECAETMTLEIDRRRTVKVIPVLFGS
jgi:hypothetical protein